MVKNLVHQHDWPAFAPFQPGYQMVKALRLIWRDRAEGARDGSTSWDGSASCLHALVLAEDGLGHTIDKWVMVGSAKDERAGGFCRDADRLGASGR